MKIANTGKMATAVIVAILVLMPVGECSTEEDKLITNLLNGYQNYGRPGTATLPVEVKYGISLQRIVKYDRETQTATLDVWENYRWTDDRLSWDSSETGIESLRFPLEELWVPDVTPYNGWNEKEDLTNIVVYRSGLCSWVPRKIWSIPCVHNETTVKCIIKVGSWTYDGGKLNLTSSNEKMDTQFIHPGYYTILQNVATRSVKTYECCPEPYIDITFSLTFSLEKQKKEPVSEPAP